MTQYNELKTDIAALSAKIDAAAAKTETMAAQLKAATTPMIYDYIDDNMPSWAREGVRYCVEHGIITGTGDGKLGLDDKDLKFCTMVMRMFKQS